jgi:hypothetical protein
MALVALTKDTVSAIPARMPPCVSAPMERILPTHHNRGPSIA